MQKCECSDLFRTSTRHWNRLLLAGALCVAPPVYGAVHALLIGVNDYRESNVSELYGPPNDVALLKQVLTGRFDIAPSSITTLINPTHTAIEKAFADLVARTRPGDQVFIHYSGHGSWTAAPASGDAETERRGQDQTWLSHGARSSRRSGKDAMDVLDKEIALWLAPIYKLTSDVVFVSDSCYSASVTRSDQFGVRSVDGSSKPHPLRSSLARVPDPTVGLRIGAARDFESAVEFDPRTRGRCTDTANCYGVFTWYWAKALQASQPGESWGDVFSRASAAVAADVRVLQRPQMEGTANRAVFGGKFASLSALIPVTEVRGDGTVILGGGLLSGVTPGSEFQGNSAGASPVPLLVISSVTAGTARARLTKGALSAGAVVREVRHRHQDARIGLYLRDSTLRVDDLALAKQVRMAIDEARSVSLQAFDLVNDERKADWRLEIIRPRLRDKPFRMALPKGAACTSRPCEAPELWVVSPQGQLMDERMRFPLGDKQAELPRLLSNLASFAHARQVRGLAAQGNETPLQVQVEVLRPPAGNTSGCADGAKKDSGWTRQGPMPFSRLRSQDVRRADCLAFTIDNRDTGRHWYGYILGIDPKFQVHLVWPPASAMQDEARIEPATSYRVSRSFYRLSEAGRETLLMVASDVPAPMINLVQPGLRGQGGSAGSALGRLLEPSVLTRGPETTIGNWGAQSFELDIGSDQPAANDKRKE